MRQQQDKDQGEIMISLQLSCSQFCQVSSGVFKTLNEQLLEKYYNT